MFLTPHAGKISYDGETMNIKNLFTKTRYKLFTELKEHFEEKLSPIFNALNRPLQMGSNILTLAPV